MEDKEISREGVSTEETQEKSEDVFAQQVKDDDFNLDEIIAAAGDEDGFGIVQEQEANEEASKKAQPDEKEISPEEKSFKYWQSQADKKQNRINELEQTLQAVQGNVQYQQALARQMPRQEKAGKLSGNGKPKPPSKPKKPAYFSKDEATTEPNSPSAQYAAEMENWRDNMLLYNQELTEWNSQQTTSKLEGMEKKEKLEKARAVQRQRQQGQLLALKDKLVGEMGASDEQAITFIKEMSQPNSISLDNLWQLFALKHGVQVGNNKSKEFSAGNHSAEFEQTKRAQSVPGSMAVMPGQSDKTNKAPEDLMIEKMLQMEKEENPFS